MFNDANDRKIENRRIQTALAVSLLLHVLVLWKFSMLPSGFSATHSGPLQVSLISSSAKLVAPDAPQAAAVAEGMPSPHEVQIVVKESVKFSAPVAPRISTEVAAAIPASGSYSSAPAQDALAQPTGLPRTGPTGAARRVEIEFEIYSGADRQLVGKGRHRYASENNESFGVSVKQMVKADDAAQDASWQLEISGRIERQGLNPLVFEMQGALPERLMALRGTSGSLPSPPGKIRSGRMPDGILDRQSLLYQFMLVPPSNNGGKLWLSDGASYGLYTYRIAGYELLAMPSIGDVLATKLVFSTAGSAELIELWLIPDKRYLPAKMRHTDGFGVVTEQVVVSLDSN